MTDWKKGTAVRQDVMEEDGNRDAVEAGFFARPELWCEERRCRRCLAHATLGVRVPAHPTVRLPSQNWLAFARNGDGVIGYGVERDERLGRARVPAG